MKRSASLSRRPTLSPLLLAIAAMLSAAWACGGEAPAPTEADAPAAAPQPAFDKWQLWTTGTQLRGANIYQRRVYPDLDGPDWMGPGPLGPPYTQEDFDRLAALGANYVNLSHPGLFSEMQPYALDDDVQANLDALLDMIAEADMFAVISFRTGPGRNEWAIIGEYGEEPSNNNVWQDEAAQQGWAAMWTHTAGRYRDNPIVVGYDLMVEPNSSGNLLDLWSPEEFYPAYAGTLYDWNQLHPRLSAAIREVDTQTPILIGGMGYSAAAWLPTLKPAADSRIVYTVHQYAPFIYTHQEPPLTLSYPGVFDADGDGAKETVDRAWLADLLFNLDEFAAANNAPVAVNEFGLMRWQPGADVFMDDQMSLFEERGINYALWAWHASWPPLAEGDHEFNFRFGPDPDSRADVETSGLIEVIRTYWALNTARPSSTTSGGTSP